MLGVSAALSEAEVHWRSFLAFLQARGLHSLTFIVSNAHCRFSAARASVFPKTHCQFHLQSRSRGTQAYVPVWT